MAEVESPTRGTFGLIGKMWDGAFMLRRVVGGNRNSYVTVNQSRLALVGYICGSFGYCACTKEPFS